MILDICFWNVDDQSNPEFHLKFKIEKNPIAVLWIKKLQYVLSKQISLTPRFSNILKERSREYLIGKLKECISIINNSWVSKHYGYNIKQISEDYTLENHNEIHLHFETLVGHTWNSTEIIKRAYKNNDTQIINAISGLNYLSHEIIELKSGPPTIIVNFFGAHITKDFLPKEADDYFTLDIATFGNIYMNYTQIGKAWVDYIVDCEKDHEHANERVLPLQILSGEFDICFGDFINNGRKVTHDDFFEWLKPRLKALGKDPYDKSLRLGKIKLASLIREGRSNEEILSEINKRKQIWSIGIIDSEKELFSENDIVYQEFEPYYNDF